MIGIVLAFSIAAVFMILNAINADTNDSDDNHEDDEDSSTTSNPGGGWGCYIAKSQIAIIKYLKNSVSDKFISYVN